MTRMMDEIHLKACFDYKGGFIAGAADKNWCPAKIANVFMVQSLLSNHKNIVHIMPVAPINANILQEFLKKLITDLELTGF